MIDAINAAKVDKIEGKSLINAEYADGVSQIENPEFVEIHTDTDDKILYGVKQDGDFYFGAGIPSQIQEELDTDLAAILDSLDSLAENKVDKEKGKSLIDEEVSESLSTIEDIEGKSEITIDSESKIISYRDTDGVKHENVGIVTEKLDFSGNGMSDFIQALNDASYSPDSGGNFSKKSIVEIPEPKRYALLNFEVSRLPIIRNELISGFCEYYDCGGNYFRKSCELSVQGQSSTWFATSGGKANFTLDITDDSKIKFGDWVQQDSFHLKGSPKDVTRGYLSTSYKLAYKILERLDAKPNRVLKKSGVTSTNATGDVLTDFGSEARCLPDGFPVEVYVNGEYQGLYTIQLKKHRDNYSMKKSDYTSFIIDADEGMAGNSGFWTGNIPWDSFEIRNPKDLILMDGSDYDGNGELIDNSSPYYDANNPKHIGSATTKAIIQAMSTKYQEIKTLITTGTPESLSTAKEKFDEYFDINACMLVYIFNCLMGNSDSIDKNTLWAVYKNGKIAPMLWDLDNMYGVGWIGYGASSPNASLWDGAYAKSIWPLSLFYRLYEQEIHDTYRLLRNEGIISMDTWNQVIHDWIERIGTYAYKRDMDKWPETPTYRKNYTDTEHWIQLGYKYGIGSDTLWDNTTSYSIGDIVVLKMHPTDEFYMRYKSKTNDNVGNCPVTKFYSKFPMVGGFYDGPTRMQKWMTEQLALSDAKNGYTNI